MCRGRIWNDQSREGRDADLRESMRRDRNRKEVKRKRNLKSGFTLARCRQGREKERYRRQKESAGETCGHLDHAKCVANQYSNILNVNQFSKIVNYICIWTDASSIDE